MKSFAYLFIFAALIFTLSVFTIPDAHAVSRTVFDGPSCNAIGGSWADATMTCFVTSLTINPGDTLLIDSSTTLEILGTLNNSGTLDIRLFCYVFGTITNNSGGVIYNYSTIDINNGSLFNNAGGTINNFGGTIVNEVGTIYNDGTINNLGTIHNSAFGEFALYAIGGVINNNSSGVINNNSTGHIDNYAVITNSGRITNNPGGDIVIFTGAYMTNNSGGTINNMGFFTNNNFFVNNPSGLITNTGIFTNNGGFVLNSGTINNNNSTKFIYNAGTIYNQGTITNSGYLVNNAKQGAPRGIIDNQGTITNNLAGNLYNGYGKIANSRGIINNLGFLQNSDPGSITNNLGTINNQCGATFTGNTPVGNPINNISCTPITINPISGPVGTKVTVKGSNYPASSSVSITYDSATVVTTPTTVTPNATGGFSATFTVPSSTPGPHTVGAGSGVSTAQATFTVTATSFPIIQMSDTTASFDSLISSSRPFIGEYVSPTSTLIGKQIDSISLRMAKVGAPTGTAQVGIFDINRNVVKLFATVDVSTISTTDTVYEFKLPANDLYTIASGDRIGFKYAGGSSSVGINVTPDRDAADPFDGTNSYRVRYETAWITSSSEDMYMILKQTHG